MSKETQSRKTDEALPTESQSQRLAKYGANVALTCVIVVILAGIVI